MAKLTIRYAVDDGRPVEFLDILDVLRFRGDDSAWELDRPKSEFWVTGRTGANISWAESMAGTGRRLPGLELRGRAADFLEVIWAEFRAFEGASPSPWASVTAFDGSFFEIVTEDESVIAHLQRKFRA